MDFIPVCIWNTKVVKLPTNFEKVSVKGISDEKDLRIIYGPITKQQFSLSWPLGKQTIIMPFSDWCLLILKHKLLNISVTVWVWTPSNFHSTQCSARINAYIPSLDYKENSLSLCICYILQLLTKLDFSKSSCI